MPRLQVIVLDKKVAGQWAYILWADVPASRKAFYINSTGTSLWTNALPSDLVNLQSGAVVERAGTINTPGLTTAQLQAELQSRWAGFQAEINIYNPWDGYGTSWNGTVWTSTGVA